MWIDFTAIALSATNNMSAAECIARPSPKQEWVVWEKTDPVSHYWLYTLPIQRFP